MSEQTGTVALPYKNKQQSTSLNLKLENTNTKSDKKKSEQNLVAALIGGSIAALVGAVIWGLVISVINMRFGLMAVGVGLLVGYSVRNLGKGIDTQFGIIGALLALVGCIMGYLFSIVIITAAKYHSGFWDILFTLDFSVIFNMMIKSFTNMDFLFYGIAIYKGFNLSFLKLGKNK